jgi:hypothetical protein
MRANRVLVAEGWYWEVLCEVRKLYVFEVRGLPIEENRVPFYNNAANGFMLPIIMQLLTFAARFNVRHGRIGHVWGERYWPRILDGEPPEWA